MNATPPSVGCRLRSPTFLLGLVLASATFPVARAIDVPLTVEPRGGAPAAADKDEIESPTDQASERSAPPGPVGGGKTKVRQREGTQLVDRSGRFERRGDRVMFLMTEPEAQFIVLENLAIERVLRVLDDEGSDRIVWSVAGLVTEFRGTNYLLVKRAVVKTTSEIREPRRLNEPAVSPLSGGSSGIASPTALRPPAPR